MSTNKAIRLPNNCFFLECPHCGCYGFDLYSDLNGKIFIECKYNNCGLYWKLEDLKNFISQDDAETTDDEEGSASEEPDDEETKEEVSSESEE